MSIRTIVNIDEDKCDGCGLCAPSCAEGAIQIVDGKARLVSEVYCDGLGACLGECPRDAITIEEREAPDFDETAVRGHLARLERDKGLTARHQEPAAPKLEPKLEACPAPAAPTCPGSAMRQLAPQSSRQPVTGPAGPSRLGHWPVQLMLVPPHAPFLKNADILVCADCVPFAVPDFHARYLAGRAVLVGCPKLDDLEFYREKLKAIFATADPRRVTVLRMEVPCCGGIAQAALEAHGDVTPDVPIEVHTIGIGGDIQCVIEHAA